MREGYARIRPPGTATKQNLVLRVGFGLVLILNATEAGTVGTTGAIWASLGTAHSSSVAVIESASKGALSGRNHPVGNAGIPVAGDLSENDVHHYKQAFAAIAAGNWSNMQDELAHVDDKSLTGHVLAARYLSSNTSKPSYVDLADWMKRYADLPEADTIYRLALRHKPSAAQPLVHPRAVNGYTGKELPACRLPGIGTMSKMRLTGDYSGEDSAHVGHLVTTVLAHLRDDAAETAQHVLAASEVATLLDPDDLAALQARVAAGLLYDGENGAALNLASESLAEGHDEALWIAGLAAYRLKRFDEAREHFEAIANAVGSEPWTGSAAAFWAGRSAERLDDRDDAERWWKRAAAYKATFYGMLAERALGIKPSLKLDSPVISVESRKLLASLPAGGRAMALLQIGETARAEAELGQIEASRNPRLKEALLAVAISAHMPDLSQRMGIGLTGSGGRQYDSGPYPVPRWQPHGGYAIDPSLIYAITRQESRFDPKAESNAGALGLMQIMPQTAAQTSSRHENWDEALLDPETNLDIGQHYVQALLTANGISQNLIMLLTAYNSGVGNLARWRANGGDQDPLMFLETLPPGETRGFVEQVLTNYWIYRLQAGEDTKSLTDLARAKWPMYAPPASRLTLIADSR